MNLLTARITWHPSAGKPVEEDCRFSKGCVDLYASRIQSFVTGCRNIFHNKASDVTCAIIGYIANLEEIKATYRIAHHEDVKVVESLYRLHGPKCIQHLEGIFSGFVADGNQQRVYLFQDEYGSNLPLYYSWNKAEVVISSSLREVLKRAVSERKLNLHAVREFLYLEHVIPNEATLIEGVNKLIPGHYLVIDYGAGSCRMKRVPVRKRRVGRAAAKAGLLESIGNHVNVLAEKLTHRELACTLSGGFDTNLLLHFLAKNGSRDLTAVTIGGRDVNEIPQAKICAESYRGVQHLCKLVDPDSLNRFPEMVWAVEGYVFDIGLFLQVVLADVIESNGIETAFLGEGADQQLVSSYKVPLLKKLEQQLKRMTRPTMVGDLYLRCMRRPRPKILRNRFAMFSTRIRFSISYDLVLKKSGIMLNSRGIQAVYPFLNRETRALARAIGRMNSGKAFYKDQVRELFCREKAECLTKIGGTTDVEYLLEGRDTLISKLLSTDLVRSLLDRKQIEWLSESPQEYSAVVLQLLFLYLFNEFYITGKYDSRFDKSGPGVTLAELLG